MARTETTKHLDMNERQRIGFLNMYFEQNLYTSKKNSICSKFFDSLQDVDWENLSKIKNLPIEFIREFANEFNESCWENICVNYKLNEEFIREFEHKFNTNCWKYISKNVKLTEEFIKEFKYYVHLPYIIQYQNISDELKDEFNSILRCKKRLAEGYRLEFEFIENFNKYGSGNRVVWNEIELKPRTTEDIILENIFRNTWGHYKDKVF